MASTASDSSAALAVAAAFLPLNGCILIAINTAWLLYGCFLVQVYHYFSLHSAKDFWLKYLVAGLVATGTMHVGFGTATQWGILVEHWGDAAIWASTPWESALGPFTSGLNGFIVQIFFVSRIIFLSKHTAARICAGIISLTSVVAFAGSIAIMTVFLKGGSNALAIQTLESVMRTWSISTVICDVMIAVTMSVILSHAHSKTKFKSTQNLLNRLIVQSIETGTVTAVDMLLLLICYETIHSNSVYMVWEFASGPLYGNALLFVLNSRQSHVQHSGVSQDVHNLSTMSATGGISRDLGRTIGGASVKVTTDVLTQYDPDAKDAELGGTRGYGHQHPFAQ